MFLGFAWFQVTKAVSPEAAFVCLDTADRSRSVLCAGGCRERARGLSGIFAYLARCARAFVSLGLRCGLLSSSMISLHEGRGSRTKKPPAQALVLGLSVVGCTPRIWRRIVVREAMWLARLHDSIQVAFDWFDYQTHTFTLGDLRLGNPAKGDGHLVEDDRDITLLDAELVKRGAMTYDYHFGEGWRVDIRVEAVVQVVKGEVYPRCLAGERAGPPEDCGGVDAHHDMLASIQDPSSELGREWLEWLGPLHDVNRCDIPLINKSLRKFSK